MICTRDSTSFAPKILITFRISWRRSYEYTNIVCNDNTIRDQNLIGVSDYMTCLKSCQGNIGSVQFYCTDYSEQEDWTSGKKSFTYTSNFDKFEFGYCMIVLILTNELHMKQVNKSSTKLLIT
ncbi:hypothetical protein CHS0354_039528 [Potamilus streckersoni]|uniref:Uncharacterized protein n=1 Tax=Potamilus streckersoni TaxID=2493646 RepID=A0AAE0TKT6_9BIVA|nr:hypothetical protein CHS0354_039528 [Potamilus streckersoni]